MRATWVTMAGTTFILFLALGCRTPRPETKPPAQPEALNVPPSENRYNVSVMPKEAFQTRDPFKKDPDIQTTKGSAGFSGPGGPGGLR